jgi:hypothetical protein
VAAAAGATARSARTAIVGTRRPGFVRWRRGAWWASCASRVRFPATREQAAGSRNGAERVGRREAFGQRFEVAAGWGGCALFPTCPARLGASSCREAPRLAADTRPARGGGEKKRALYHAVE